LARFLYIIYLEEFIMLRKPLFTLAMLAVVSVAPHEADAASITNAQISILNQDEETIASNVQLFYANSQRLISNGQILPLTEEQQGLTAVESELNAIISAEQNELAVLQQRADLRTLCQSSSLLSAIGVFF
jgi:hypothetical protein